MCRIVLSCQLTDGHKHLHIRRSTLNHLCTSGGGGFLIGRDVTYGVSGFDERSNSKINLACRPSTKWGETRQPWKFPVKGASYIRDPVMFHKIIRYPKTKYTIPVMRDQRKDTTDNWRTIICVCLYIPSRDGGSPADPSSSAHCTSSDGKGVESVCLGRQLCIKGRTMRRWIDIWLYANSFL